MNFLRVLLGLSCATASVAAELPAPPPPVPPAPTIEKHQESQWVFDLLPKSLQKNPRLELTVITEMTAAGRKLPPVSPPAPAYFDLFTTGPRDIGFPPGGKTPIKQSEVESVLLRSLATSGYLPAKAPNKPSIQIIYTWGSHYLLTEGDDENPVNSGEMIARNMLDRAALVGGEKFARELLEAFEQADSMAIAANAPVPPGGQPVITPEMVEFANPVNIFKRRSPKNEMLVDQTASDVYYVVASAYDYQALLEKRRLLLWRTRMTVAAAGVSAEQAMPTLMLAAGPYFGKEMTEAEVINKRALRDANVQIGPTTVVEADVAAPAPKKN